MKKRSVAFILIGCFALAVTKGTAAEPERTDQELISLYEGLRVADVSDGMDSIGLRDTGLMSSEIGPLWKDIDTFGHQVVGIAMTARYVPTNKLPSPGEVPIEKFKYFRDMWYTHDAPEPFKKTLRKGHVLVIDNSGTDEASTIGSKNSMEWTAKGAVGIIANQGIRDLDEISRQRIPVYSDSRKRGRGVRPGRNQLESFNEPVVLGGVFVRPGDVVVADGDGVIVVPRERAAEVAAFALTEKRIDMKGRAKLYEELGIPVDETVQSPLP